MNLDELHKEHLKQHEKAGIDNHMKMQLEEHYRLTRELHLEYIKEELKKTKNGKLKIFIVNLLSNFLYIDKEFIIDVVVRFIIYFFVIYYVLKTFNFL